MGKRWDEIEREVKVALGKYATKFEVIEDADLLKHGNYEVEAVIFEPKPKMTSLAQGTYESGQMIHAEMAAIEDYASKKKIEDGKFPKGLGLTTSLSPCPRCAIILRIFQKRFGWKVWAPSNAFAKNSSGSYNIPEQVSLVIFKELVENKVVSSDEAVTYKSQISSLIKGFEFVG
ncbi:MAG TPA: hypothetical protein VF928_11945 [Usitatibacteraceae bacterium]